MTELRSFGWQMAGILGFIGLWPLLHARGPKFPILGLAAAFALIGWLRPGLLAQPRRAWLALGNVLGWINLRIILGVLFVGMIIPIALIRKLLGKGLYPIAPESGAESYLVSVQPRATDHFKHPY